MRPVLLLLGLALAVPASAQAPPDLGSQPAWGDKEKQEFLKYLRSGQAAPVEGSVKNVGPAPKPAKARRARYATLSLAADTVFTVDPAGAVDAQSTAIGPRLLVGGHLFSWVRYYTGARYAVFSQDRLDGKTGSVAHFEAPLGLELALIPLGTPHTRYVLLRGGVSLHHFSGASSLVVPLDGWKASWNFGLGYEWQMPDTSWRLHLTVEGYKSFEKSPGFYGVGPNAGVAYTF